MGNDDDSKALIVCGPKMAADIETKVPDAKGSILIATWIQPEDDNFLIVIDGEKFEKLIDDGEIAEKMEELEE